MAARLEILERTLLRDALLKTNPELLIKIDAELIEFAYKELERGGEYGHDK